MSEEEPLAFDDPAVRIDRLERQVASLTDELQHRIAQVEGLRHLGAKAAELDALLATKTMRALAVPRRLYARVRSSMPHGEP